MTDYTAESLEKENLDRWYHMYRKGKLSRREFCRVLAMLSAASIAVGCTPASPTEMPTNIPPTQAAPTKKLDPTATQVPGKDTLIISFEQDEPTLDPHMHSSRHLINLFYHTHDNLGTRDLTTMKMGPHLAKSWLAIEPTIWEMELRDDVVFHNGEPFDAETVKYNFERVTNPEQKSPQMGNFEPFEAVEIISPYKLRIITKSPWPIFAERLQNFQMIPPKYTMEKGDEYAGSNPVGTGPYKFVSWKRDQEIVLERNESYWGAKPVFKNLVIRIIPEKATEIAELLAGKIDIMRAVPTDQMNVIDNSGVAKTKIQDALRVFMIGLDARGRTGDNPFQDVRVRRAVNHAVDIDGIIKNLQVGGKRAPALLNPMHFAFDPSIEPYEYDPDKAMALLAEAGYPDGFSTKMASPSGHLLPNARLVEQAIQRDLGKVGINMENEILQGSTFNELQDNGTLAPMINMSWGSYSVFDPDALYYLITYSKSNKSYWTNEEFDKLIEEAHTIVDQDRRLVLYQQAQKIVRDEAPYLFLFTLVGVWATSSSIIWSPDPDEIERWYNAKPA